MLVINLYKKEINTCCHIETSASFTFVVGTARLAFFNRKISNFLGEIVRVVLLLDKIPIVLFNKSSLASSCN